MKKKIIILALSTLVAALIGARVSATSFSAARNLCSNWGGTWSNGMCSGSALDGKKSQCESSGGSYTKTSNNGREFNIKCSWHFANTSYKCIGFVADSSGNKKTTSKEYCANKLYTSSSAVSSYCSVGKDKAACADYISSSMSSYVSGVGTVSQSTIDSALDNYASSVAGVMTTQNVDPCGYTRGNQGYSYCIRADSNWKFYYETEEQKNPTVNPTTPSDDDDDDDSDDDSDDSGVDKSIADVSEGSCTSILPGDWCNSKDGISSVINMIVTVLTGAVVVAGTVGIIICGFLWMTARENEAQVAMAKKRMLDIVIGIIAWVLLALLANLFIPKSSGDIETDMGYINNSKDLKS